MGLGKTGSSTIQRQLLQHADELEARFKLHFPRHFQDPRPFGGNHTLLLGSLFKDSPERMRANILAGFDTPERVAQLNKNALRQFEHGLALSGADCLLFSAEGAGDFNPATNTRLLHWLQSLAMEVKVIACLRHPADALASAIQQKLKTDGVLENLYRNPPSYKFIRLFTALEQVLDRSDIILYDYAAVARSEAGLTAEFMRQLDFEAEGLFDPEQVVNPSMSHKAALLLSSLNRQRPRLIDKVPNPARRGDDLRKFLAIQGPGFQVPVEVYELLEKKVKAELEWLRVRYGIELTRMQEPPDEVVQACDQETIDQLALELADSAG